MPRRAKAPRHRFDLALVQSASNGVEVNFHQLLFSHTLALAGSAREKTWLSRLGRDGIVKKKFSAANFREKFKKIRANS